MGDHRRLGSRSIDMARAIWRGFLRLSLVSCPVYLTPATRKVQPVRLHKVWVPRSEPRVSTAPEPDDEDDLARRPTARPKGQKQRREERVSRSPSAETKTITTPSPVRIALRPHDPITGAEIEGGEVRKGFETDTGQLVAFTPEEVRSLDLIESARAIDLATFVPQGQLDPLYFDAPLYLHPDGETAVEAYQVIAAAMTESGTAGIGRVAIRRRGHMALVMPREAAWRCSHCVQRKKCCQPSSRLRNVIWTRR